MTYGEDKKKGIECDLYDFNGNFVKKIYFKNPPLYIDDTPTKLKFKNGKIYSIIQTEEEWYRVVRYKLN